MCIINVNYTYKAQVFADDHGRGIVGDYWQPLPDPPPNEDKKK